MLFIKPLSISQSVATSKGCRAHESTGGTESLKIITFLSLVSVAFESSEYISPSKVSAHISHCTAVTVHCNGILGQL